MANGRKREALFSHFIPPRWKKKRYFLISPNPWTPSWILHRLQGITDGWIADSVSFINITPLSRLFPAEPHSRGSCTTTGSCLTRRTENRQCKINVLAIQDGGIGHCQGFRPSLSFEWCNEEESLGLPCFTREKWWVLIHKSPSGQWPGSQLSWHAGLDQMWQDCESGCDGSHLRTPGWHFKPVLLDLE